MPKGVYIRTLKHRKALRRDVKGSKNPRWKGGKSMNNGYIIILEPNHPFYVAGKYVYEHRLVVEKQIGRYLLPSEITHHLNGIKDDNLPENLMAFVNHSAHIRFEKGYHIKSQDIIFDGRKILPPSFHK